MTKAALKLVEGAPFFRRGVEFWESDVARDSHSLHYLLPYPEESRPEISHFVISQCSERRDIVVDPFCGSGSTVLSANLLGRVACASDSSPLALRITEAKSQPVDLSMVTLRLQRMNLKRPINVAVFHEFFQPFFELNTFREISNLRNELRKESDSTSRFIEGVLLSILHGHTAGYLSTYTSPLISMHPDSQLALNARRKSKPEYRAVIPRILRKAASALRDGIPSALLAVSEWNRYSVRDARDLSYIKSGEADLVVTAPPLPDGTDHVRDLWLRAWFSGFSPKTIAPACFVGSSLESWLEFMNEVLLELARVTKPGRRAFFIVRDVVIGEETVLIDERMVDMVERDLSKFWEPEGILFNQKRPQSAKKPAPRVVVLRRRVG